MSEPKGFAAYRDDIADIASWMPDWLSQDDFDRRAALWAAHDHNFKRFEGETYLLPFHQPALALLHMMQAHGLVDARERNGRIEYRSADHHPPRAATLA